MQYTQAVVKGFSWQTLLRISLAGLSLIKIFFLARLLDPSDFGVFALIAVALGVSEAVTQTGINITIIQTQNDPKKLINTAWIVAIIRGLLIAVILICLGPVMSKFFANSRLLELALLASFIPIIKGFINPSIAIWQKNFLFKLDALFHILRQLVEVIATVLLAVIWPNVAMLIWGMIIAALFELFLSFIMAKPRPVFKYDQTAARTIFQNAKGLSITAALSYLTENLDDLILGKTLGSYNLGLYHNGYAIAHKFTYEPAKAANYSLLSAYAKITTNHSRLWRGFIKAFLVVSSSLAVVVIGVILFKKILVDLILGPSWAEVIPILPWLAIAGLGQALIAMIYTFLIAKKQYFLLNAHLASTVALSSVTIYYASVSLGLPGAVAALALTRWVLIIPLTWFTSKEYLINPKAHD